MREKLGYIEKNITRLKQNVIRIKSHNVSGRKYLKSYRENIRNDTKDTGI